MTAVMQNPKLLWRWEGDKVLLNTFIVLNQTAGEIFEYCAEPQPLPSLVEYMQNRYRDVPPDKIEKDTLRIVAQLVKKRILIPEDFDYRKEPIPVDPHPLEQLKKHFNMSLRSPFSVSIDITYQHPPGYESLQVLPPLKGRTELLSDQWKDFITLLADEGVFAVTFAGGEPLLRPDLEELLAHSKEKGLFTSLHSNGVAPEERIQALVETGLGAVYIRLDGPDALSHERIRKLPGSFDTIVRTITVLLERNISVIALFTLLRENLDELESTLLFIHELGVQRVGLEGFHGEEPLYAQLSLSLDQYADAIRRVHTLENELEGLRITYPDVPAAVFQKSVGLEAYERMHKLGQLESCHACITSCSVNPYGDIQACSLTIGVSMGNILHDDFLALWHDHEIAHHLRTITKAQQHPCSQCRLQPVCVGGCNALPQQLKPSGDRFSADPLCEQCFEQYKRTIRGE